MGTAGVVSFTGGADLALVFRVDFFLDRVAECLAQESPRIKRAQQSQGVFMSGVC